MRPCVRERRARHVSFNSIVGFSTFEGQPPEQIAGQACKCPIANHHLRGYGVSRWEGQDAFIEHHESDSGGMAMVNVRAHRDEIRKQAAQLTGARAEVKRLREALRESAEKLDEANSVQVTQEEELKELRARKVKKAALEERHRCARVHESSWATDPCLLSHDVRSYVFGSRPPAGR